MSAGPLFSPVTTAWARARVVGSYVQTATVWHVSWVDNGRGQRVKTYAGAGPALLGRKTARLAPDAGLPGTAAPSTRAYYNWFYAPTVALGDPRSPPSEPWLGVGDHLVIDGLTYEVQTIDPAGPEDLEARAICWMEVQSGGRLPL